VHPHPFCYEKEYNYSGSTSLLLVYYKNILGIKFYIL